MGLPTVWVIDPQTRRAQIHGAGVTHEVLDDMLRAGDRIEGPVVELFD